MNCLYCKKETDNPKYCSRSCSASHANSLNPKRKRTERYYTCKKCGSKTLTRSYYCEKCHPRNKDEMLKDIIYEKHHRSSAFALVRSKARSEGKKLGFCKCIKCGYDIHIEVCHIKPISSFPLDTKVSIINDSKNLLPLCPNCHWEYDNGLLKL